MNRFFIIAFILHWSFTGKGQQFQLHDGASIAFSGNMEAFFSFDFNSTTAPGKAPMLVNYKNNREVNVNFGMVKVNYTAANARANFGMMAGTYVQNNLATESEFVRNIYEANAGFKLSQKNNIWFDAGIMPSHIGYEGMLSQENLTLTRSMAGDNSPYYETGMRLSYTSNNDKWYLAGMLLNGWQRIGRNSPLAFGFQLRYKHGDRFTINYSNFLGKMNLTEFRHFHNIYATIQVAQKWNMIAGIDLGFQKLNATYAKARGWYTPSLVVQYVHSDKLKMAARAEYFSDTAGVVVPLQNYAGAQNFSASLNIDYHVTKNFIWRNELKGISSDRNLFYNKEIAEARSSNYSFTSALTFYF